MTVGLPESNRANDTILRDVSFDNCVKYIQLVKDLVDGAWLSQELLKIRSYQPPKHLRRLSFIDYTKKFHPLAFLIHQANRQLELLTDGEYFRPTQEFLRLSYLGENLSILRDKKTKGIDDKIEELTSPSFDKTTSLFG